MALKDLMAKARSAGAERARPADGFGPITLPLAAYYRGDPDRERRRAEFYARCAVAFGFAAWRPRAAGPKIDSRPGRDGQRQLIEKYGHLAIASFRNNMAHPVEFFEASPRVLQESKRRARGRKIEQIIGAANRRIRLARWWHEQKLGSQITPMKGVDPEAIGGGGFGPRTPTDHAVDCIATVIQIERAMPTTIRRALNACLFEGRFVFDLPDQEDRETVLDQIRMGLDLVAFGKREISDEELVEIWPEILDLRIDEEQRREASRRRRLRRLKREPE